ncbi:prephenate dehydrogenase [Botrimarina hoheduenensis]|uniref:Prephenate dehydrogenase n=1 Tax=Botrimarina hoheduenensis TaxID=2528000 RepID=A0A5C5WDH5_9BACT|nr:prephenate dehydrogenase/arogenate dehydrogenase family protein [Botrimarina hoheduenensis]TWT48557.1 prephenate dehydrogenase [Botrimarina hoheduenensis]
MQLPRFERVVVVGVGLIGGSVALAVRERGLARTVIGISRSPQSVDRLLELGVVDEATTNAREALAKADLVVVCSPVGAAVEAVLAGLRDAPEHALVTDAASTKSGLINQIYAEHPRGGDRYLGAHPLAGDHRSGPEWARADLFVGATTVVTPVPQTAPMTSDAISGFWGALGSRVLSLTPAEHDTRLARTSHLPHVVAAALAAATSEEDLLLAATGWADTTRVAAGSAALWRDILMANAPATAQAIANLQMQLTEWSQAIQNADAQRIEQLLEDGKRRRDALGS